MYKLKNITKENLASCVKMSYQSIVGLDYVDEVKMVESKLGKKLCFSSTRDLRKAGRGNPLLARKRFKTIQQVNARLAEIK